MKSTVLIGLLVLSLLAFSPLATVIAAPTDIVPRASTLNDAIAKIAGAGLLGHEYGASDFLWESQWTRAQLAQILERKLLDRPTLLSSAQANETLEPALRAAIVSLRPELTADGYDAQAFL